MADIGTCTGESGFATRLAQDLDAADVRIVLEMFREDIGRLIHLLEGDAAAADAAMFRRNCHAMAGAAGAVGAAALEAACRRAMTQADPWPGGLAAFAAEIGVLGAAARNEAAGLLGGGAVGAGGGA